MTTTQNEITRLTRLVQAEKDCENRLCDELAQAQQRVIYLQGVCHAQGNRRKDAQEKLSQALVAEAKTS